MFITKASALAVVSEIKEITGRDINIMDESGVIFASTDAGRIGQLHEGACRLLATGLPSLTVEADDPARGECRGINLPIRVADQTVGVIGITGPPQEVMALGGIVQRMTEISVREAVTREQRTLMEQARQAFVENWLFAEDPDLSELELRGKMLGIDVTVPWFAVILEVEATQPGQELLNARFTNHIRPYLNADSQGLCAVINQRILLLLQSSDRHLAYSSTTLIRESLAHSFQISVCGGISAGGRTGLEVRRSYREARSACRTARNSGAPVLAYNEMSLEFLADSIPPALSRDLRALVFGNCTAEERSEVREAVLLYFQHAGNTQQIADALFIHKNTVQYRLQKVEKLTGYSLRRPKDAVLLYLASLSEEQ